MGGSRLPSPLKPNETMRTYAIWYVQVWGQMSRVCKYVQASSFNHAEMKFYGTKASDNCLRIIKIEAC